MREMFGSRNPSRQEPSPGPGWVTLPDSKDSDYSAEEDAEEEKTTSSLLLKTESSSYEPSDLSSRAKLPFNTREDSKLMPPPPLPSTQSASHQTLDRFIKKIARKSRGERESKRHGSDSPPAIRRNKRAPLQSHSSPSNFNQSMESLSPPRQPPRHIDFSLKKKRENTALSLSTDSNLSPDYSKQSGSLLESSGSKGQTKCFTPSIEPSHLPVRQSDKPPVQGPVIPVLLSERQSVKNNSVKGSLNKLSTSRSALDAYVVTKVNTQVTSDKLEPAKKKESDLAPKTPPKGRRFATPPVIELSSSDEEVPHPTLPRRKLTFAQTGTADDQIVLEEMDFERCIHLQSPPAKKPVKKPIKLKPPRKSLPDDFKPMSAGVIELLSSDDEIHRSSRVTGDAVVNGEQNDILDTSDERNIFHDQDMSIHQTIDSLAGMTVESIPSEEVHLSQSCLPTPPPSSATDLAGTEGPSSTPDQYNSLDDKNADFAEHVYHESGNSKEPLPLNLPQSTAQITRDNFSPVDAEMAEIDALLAPIAIPAPLLSPQPLASENKIKEPPSTEPEYHDRLESPVGQQRDKSSQRRRDSIVAKADERATINSPIRNGPRHNQIMSFGFFSGAIRGRDEGTFTPSVHKEMDSTPLPQSRIPSTPGTDTVAQLAIAVSTCIAKSPALASAVSESEEPVVARAEMGASVELPNRNSMDSCPSEGSSRDAQSGKNLISSQFSETSSSASLVNVLNAARDRYVRSRIRRPARIPLASVDLTGSNSDEEAAEVERSSELLGQLIPGLSAKLVTSRNTVAVSRPQSPEQQLVSPASSSARPKSRMGDLSEVMQVRMLAKKRGQSSTPPRLAGAAHSTARSNNPIVRDVEHMTGEFQTSSQISSSVTGGQSIVASIPASNAVHLMQSSKALVTVSPFSKEQTFEAEIPVRESEGRITEEIQSVDLKRTRSISTSNDTICEENLEALKENLTGRLPKKRKLLIATSDNLSLDGTAEQESQYLNKDFLADASSIIIVPRMSSSPRSGEGGGDSFVGAVQERLPATGNGIIIPVSRRSESSTPSFEELRSNNPDVAEGRELLQGQERSVRKYHSLWRDISRTARKEFTNIYVKAKDLPHDLANAVNSIPDWDRNPKLLQQIFESHIMINTSNDEPDAPPIQILNEVDVDENPTPPFEFHYNNLIWHGEGVPPPDYKNLKGCDCVGVCDPDFGPCSCAERQREIYQNLRPGELLYDDQGRLKYMGYPIFECNDFCGCSDDCRNRVVQLGRKCTVHIVKTAKKGWGVFAGRKIPRGTFIGIYAGEMITDAEGEERGKLYSTIGRTYLFDIDFWYLPNPVDHPVKYTIDAFHVGNFTRFLNHSCDPNCSISPCYINESNIDKPLLAIFASCDIRDGEELCFSYFGNDDEEYVQQQERETSQCSSPATSPGHNRTSMKWGKCECGAARCRGYLFN